MVRGTLSGLKKSFLFFFCIPVLVQAQMGTLDNTFGTSGSTSTNISSNNTDEGRSVVEQSDGKIVVVGTMNNGTDNDMIVFRYNANGTLDNTFDADGKVTIDVFGNNDYATAVVIQKDGKILVGGSTSSNFKSDFLVARLNTDGSLDQGFADAGIYSSSMALDNDEVTSICLYSNGNILLCGSVDHNEDEYMTKYVLGMNLIDEMGLPVSSFGDMGKMKDTLILNPGGIALINDDKIVGVGESDANYVIVGRYLSTGAFDNSFDSDHLATTQKAGSSKGTVVAVQTDGKIVVGGTKNGGGKSSVAVFRFTTSGSLDNAFSADGMDTLSIGTFKPMQNDYINGLVITTKGKIVLGGHYFGFSPYAADMFVIQYTSAGVLDNAFDGDGKNKFASSGLQLRTANSQALALQSDGKLLLAGYSINSTYQYSAYTLRINGEQPAVVPKLPTITAQPSNIKPCLAATGNFTLTASDATSYEWQKFYSNDWGYLGKPVVSTKNVSDLVYSGDGINSYIAYSDLDNSGKGTLLKSVDTGWVAVGGNFSTSFASNLKMVDAGDDVYVAFADVSNNSLLTVKKYDGTTWTTLGAALSAGPSTDFNIVLSGADLYAIYTESPSGYLYVKKYNGTAWVNVGSSPLVNHQTGSVDIKVNGSNPYIVFADSSSGYASVVKKYNGSVWQNVGTLNSEKFVGVNRLAFDGSTPYLAYQSFGSASVYVSKFDGTNWTKDSVCAADNFSFEVHNTKPYLSILKGSSNSVIKYNGTKWDTIGTKNFNKAPITVSHLFFRDNEPAVLIDENSKAALMQYNVWSTMKASATAAYAITNITDENSGTYRCVVKNAVGTVVSSSVTLVATDCSLPVINTQPSLLTGCIGDELVIKAATAKADSYKWQVKNGNSWLDLAGRVSDTLKFSALTVNDQKTYRIVATNTFGATNSNEATVTALNCTSPNFTTNITVKAKYCVSVNDEVVSSVQRADSYQWKKWDGSNWNAVSNATNANLNTSSFAVADSGTYRCEATNTYGTTNSNSFKLKFVLCTPPDITQNPTDTLKSCYFESDSTDITADRADSYQWQQAVYGWRQSHVVSPGDGWWGTSTLVSDQITYYSTTINRNDFDIYVYKLEEGVSTQMGVPIHVNYELYTTKLFWVGSDLYLNIAFWGRDHWGQAQLYKYNGTNWELSPSLGFNDGYRYEIFNIGNRLYQMGFDYDGSIQVQYLDKNGWNFLPSPGNYGSTYAYLMHDGKTSAITSYGGSPIISYLDANNGYELQIKYYDEDQKKWNAVGAPLPKGIRKWDIVEDGGYIYVAYKVGDLYEYKRVQMFTNTWQTVANSYDFKAGLNEWNSYWGAGYYDDYYGNIELKVVNSYHYLTVDGFMHQLKKAQWKFMPYYGHFDAVSYDSKGLYAINMWGWQGASLYRFDGIVRWDNMPGQTSVKLKLDNLDKDYVGAYRCLATNEYGSTPTNSTYLTAKDCRLPVVKTQPYNACYAGVQAIMQLDTLAESFQWQKKVNTTYQNVQGQTNMNLIFAGNSGTNFGIYRCAVSNLNGTVYTDSVQLDTFNCVPPVITTQPVSKVICSGTSTSFSLTSPNATSYQWYKYDISVGWSYAGLAGVSSNASVSNSIAMDGKEPIIAYQDYDRNSKATVMKYNETNMTWSPLGFKGFTEGTAQYVSVAMKGSTPLIAYKDGAKGGKLTVKEFNGFKWTNVGAAGFSAGSASSIALVVDAGIPYVAFVDDASSGKITVMKYVSNSWSIVGTAGFADPSQATGLEKFTFDVENGVPYVAFTEASNVSVMKFNGSSWAYVGTKGIASTNASLPSIKVDNGIVYVAYKNASLKTTVKSFDGSSWTAVGTESFSANPASEIKLNMSSGKPYVAYVDATTGFAEMMRYDGAQWVFLSTNISEGKSSSLNFAMFENTPYVVYSDESHGNKADVKLYGAWVPVNNGTAATLSINNAKKDEFTQYRCRVANTKGALLSDVVELQFCVGTEELESEILFRAYPNPADNSITLETDQRNTSYVIVDAIGQFVGSGLISGKVQVSVDHLAAGIYYIKLMNTNKVIGVSVIH